MGPDPLARALREIDERQKALAWEGLLKARAEGGDPAFRFGQLAGRVQGLADAREIIVNILNPKPEKGS
jgi:hypothetical protein